MFVSALYRSIQCSHGADDSRCIFFSVVVVWNDGRHNGPQSHPFFSHYEIFRQAYCLFSSYKRKDVDFLWPLEALFLSEVTGVWYESLEITSRLLVGYRRPGGSRIPPVVLPYHPPQLGWGQSRISVCSVYWDALYKKKKEFMKNYLLHNSQGKRCSFQELGDWNLKPIGKEVIENVLSLPPKIEKLQKDLKRI